MPREADKVDLVANSSWISGSAKAPPLVNQLRSPAELALRVIGELHSKSLLIQVGNQLIDLAERAYGSRELNRLAELTQTLLALPLPSQYRSAAEYFRGLELLRRDDISGAKSLLEHVASEPRHPYTARAILSLGVVFQRLGDLESALKLYLEARHCSISSIEVDLLTGVLVQKNLVVFKSMQGDHPGALADLERMAPFAETIGKHHPYVYYDYQNSFAVEYGELGLLDEAERAARIAVSSSLASAYPEWLQTFNDLTIKTSRSPRSAILVRQPLTEDPHHENDENHNVFHLSFNDRLDETDPGRPQRGKQARVLSFEQWKKVIKASNTRPPQAITAEQRTRMSTGEKLIRLMDLISHDETDDETIDNILEAVEAIVLKRKPLKID
jgi:tetratricopeptide (TPR) repeat protein